MSINIKSMARKIILYSALSIDGRIAGGNHSVDFLEDPSYHIPDEDFGYSKIQASVDTTLMGYNTYKFVENYEGDFPYPDTRNFVFSRQERSSIHPVTFINEDPASFCKELITQPGKDIWLIGGGQLNSALLEAGLIHKMILTYIPVVLNDGIHLFNGTEFLSKFRLTDTTSWKNGFVNLEYESIDQTITD